MFGQDGIVQLHHLDAAQAQAFPFETVDDFPTNSRWMALGFRMTSVLSMTNNINDV